MNGEQRDQDAGPSSAATRRSVLGAQVRLLLGAGAAMVGSSTARAAPRPPCFLAGTRIRTGDGARSVERLAVGDHVITMFGGLRRVQWVGCWRATRSERQAWTADLRPVRIGRSAIAADVPDTDVFVSQGHAIFIDGVLIPAGELVNGASITLHDPRETLELAYYHVKLESHDVVFASGLPAETLFERPAGGIGIDAASGRVRGDDVHCAPIICNGYGSRTIARARSWAAPWLGPSKLDLIHSRLLDQIAMSGAGGAGI